MTVFNPVCCPFDSIIEVCYCVRSYFIGGSMTSTDWTPEEVETALAVLEKIAFCQNQEVDMPGSVFEAHVRSKKNISTEAVILDSAGRIYLVRRPTLEENPSEAYPSQLHCPGVTHGKNEFTEDSFRRLEAREFGGVKFASVAEITSSEIHDERGLYMLRIYLCAVTEEPHNLRGQFYRPEDIPWSEVVSYHRNIVIPAALAVANSNKQ